LVIFLAEKEIIIFLVVVDLNATTTAECFNNVNFDDDDEDDWAEADETSESRQGANTAIQHQEITKQRFIILPLIFVLV
jgi:hypothetical protein